MQFSTEALVASIRREFETVPFPSHCGLHAAMAKDAWVNDAGVLAEKTSREDFVGRWWNVPIEHLRSCMMALSYLDSHAMAFYLPAYMTALLERPEAFDTAKLSSSWQIAHAMLPVREDPRLQQYFLSRFSSMDAGKKRVCREFLGYLTSSAAYNEEARKIAREALLHEFWSKQS